MNFCVLNPRSVVPFSTVVLFPVGAIYPFPKRNPLCPEAVACILKSPSTVPRAPTSLPSFRK